MPPIQTGFVPAMVVADSGDAWSMGDNSKNIEGA